MKTPSYSKALCIAAFVSSMAQEASAFTQASSLATSSSLSSSTSASASASASSNIELQASLASTIYFPGHNRSTGFGTPLDKKQENTPATAPPPARQNTMELIDQFKHDASVIFAIIDSDASGSISREKFANHLLRAKCSEQFVNELFDRMDVHGRGAISDSEFRSLYLTVPSLRTLPGMGQFATDPNTMAVGDELFQSLDVDGNGFIGFVELLVHLNNNKNNQFFEDEAMIKIFSLLDADQDLSLSKQEFRDAYWRYSAFRNAMIVEGEQEEQEREQEQQ
ncbi:unnamed protein product [Cylindrotheca closterium]|uniref:EF-hand domain-containing protein n=1 Tax=Cylindrotheca closterium TaxID=2856 RepID=A0AAD2G1E3_9STRA|nr:unnamed protein product [Cylindrotheca closterium]